MPLLLNLYFFISVLVFAHESLTTDEFCSLRTDGTPGRCKKLNDCPAAMNDLIKNKKFPQTCGFEGSHPVVCCPPRIPGEISRKKCIEYSAFAFERNSSTCPLDIVKLIVGGVAADRREFPHMAAVHIKEPSGWMKFVCAGSLISPWFVLTAAHCLIQDLTHVTVGVTDLTLNDHKQEIQISDKLPYPKFNISSTYFDVGLLKLAHPVNFTPYARPACLYRHEGVLSKTAIATGWGITENNTLSNKLLKVTLELVDNTNCNESYKDRINRKFSMGILDAMHICAMSDDGTRKDTCRGDSGGPLQVIHSGDDAPCTYDILAVTSFGKTPCGDVGIYARVSFYLKWIEDIVWREE